MLLLFIYETTIDWWEEKGWNEKILGTAAYEELHHSMHMIREQYPEVETTIFTADLVVKEKSCC